MTGSSLKIIPLQIDQLSIVRELAYKTWPDTFASILSGEQITYMLNWMYDLEILQNQLKDGHSFYAAYSGDTPVGFIGFESRYKNEPQVKIHKLYVLPEMQGSGTGKKLIQLAEEIAKSSGDLQLVLNVNRFNKAVGFYERLGFRKAYEEDIDIGNGYLMEDYVMIKDL